MGRILRKNRVGIQDSENFAAAKSGALKSSEVLTVSKEDTRNRSVLMDKTNALKRKNEAKQKIIAKATNLKDDQKRSQNPKEAEEKVGKVTRRRRSSKENVKEPRKSPLDDKNSKPLGDKTNASQRKQLLQGEVGSKIDETEAICKDGKVASKEDSISCDEENIPNVVSLESPTKKRPSRNAAKFEDGWITALRRSRTSKERDAESQKPSPPKTKSKTAITSQVHETSAPEQNKRTRHGAKAAKTEDQVKIDVETEENLASHEQKSAQQGVFRDSSSKLQKSYTLSSESDSSQTCPDEVDESPRRKLPPRNAAKYEKGWISSLLKPRNSKENGGDIQKSPSKSTPANDQSNSHQKDGKAGTAEDTGKDKGKTHLSSTLKINIEAVPSDPVDEKDLVSEQKVPGRPLGRGKNRLRSSTKDVIVEENAPETTQKPAAGSALESKPRGLKNFESRIAAKLGIDMSSDPKPKNKSPKKPSVKETFSRRLRKRGVDKKIKTYAEIGENEGEVEENLSKKNRKSPVKPSIVSQKAKMRELGNIVAKSAPTGSHDEAVVKSISNKPAQNAAVSKSDPSHSNFEPKPGCSRDPDFTTPLRRTGPSEVDGAKKSPMVAPTSSLFSIFKKPETPRRSSLENKIFVSGSNGSPAEATAKKQLPVYRNPNMTPLKKTSALPQEKKEELYEFEFDENEPKPKKKHKPIMKIQRIRAVKRKKPKVYEADPETERRVLRNLDLSPSVFEEFRSAKKKKIENAAGVVAAQPSKSAHPAEAADLHDIHPSETDATDGLGFDGGPMSSPCRDYGHSTPIRTDAPSMILEDYRDKYGRLSAKVYSPVKSKDSPMRNETPNMFMDDGRDKSGLLTAKVYSPVNAKDSPIPVLMAEYNNDPGRRDDSSRRSIVSNASCASAGNSIYHDDLDISASTPVKFNKNDSTYARQRRKPLELNLSNCFGFDEPELMEEPLVSPIKSTTHVPEQTPRLRPVPILKSKPPLMRPPLETVAVDVDEVIKQLRFEVGDDSSANNSANISVYDDSEITWKNKSPIKRYLQPKDDHKHPKRKSPAKNAADGSTHDEGNDSFSPIKVAPKVQHSKSSIHFFNILFYGF